MYLYPTSPTTLESSVEPWPWVAPNDATEAAASSAGACSITVGIGDIVSQTFLTDAILRLSSAVDGEIVED